MSNERLVIIVNRKAGTARRLGRTGLLKALQIVNRPIQLMWLHPSELSTWIQKLINDGTDKLVIGGGDGTINQSNIWSALKLYFSPCH